MRAVLASYLAAAAKTLLWPVCLKYIHFSLPVVRKRTCAANGPWSSSFPEFVCGWSMQNGDYDALCEAQTSAWHYLTPLQNEIVHFLPGKMRE